MTTYDFDIGIIGGGAAGLTVAAGAAQLGARTLLVEREPRLGGDCLHYGCVPSKTLIRTARVYHTIRQAERFGLPRAETGPVDFKKVAARIQQVINEIQQHDSVERFCSLGARVEFGEASFRDEHAISLNGRTVSARSWVIATGSSPAIPQVPGLAQVSYLTNREIFSLEELPASLIVLGGGPIAVEMAQAFARLGSEVHLVQRSAQILSREDRDMADLAMATLQAEGVVFHLESRLLEVREQNGRKEVVLAQGEATKTVRAAALLVALGRSPNINGLNLEAIGVEAGRSGIPVDRRQRTSHKHIYAAGDVTGRFQFTHAAGYEGGIVVANAVFHLPRRADHTLLPWCTYIDPELASIGMNEKRALDAGITPTVLVEEFADNDRFRTEGGSSGRLKLLLGAGQKPIGVQILGPHAGELIGEWVAALAGKLSLATISGAIHPYPTLVEINKRAVSSFLGNKIFSEKVRKGLTFFFNYKGRACEMADDRDRPAAEENGD